MVSGPTRERRHRQDQLVGTRADSSALEVDEQGGGLTPYHRPHHYQWLILEYSQTFAVTSWLVIKCLKLPFTQSQLTHDCRCANKTDVDIDLCGCACIVLTPSSNLHFMWPPMSDSKENLFIVRFRAFPALFLWFLPPSSKKQQQKTVV